MMAHDVLDFSVSLIWPHCHTLAASIFYLKFVETIILNIFTIFNPPDNSINRVAFAFVNVQHVWTQWKTFRAILFFSNFRFPVILKYYDFKFNQTKKTSFIGNKTRGSSKKILARWNTIP